MKLKQKLWADICAEYSPCDGSIQLTRSNSLEGGTFLILALGFHALGALDAFRAEIKAVEDKAEAELRERFHQAREEHGEPTLNANARAEEEFGKRLGDARAGGTMKEAWEIQSALKVIEATLKDPVFDRIDKERAEIVLIGMANEILSIASQVVTEARSAQ